MATKQNITLAQAEAKEHLKPYCEKAEKTAKLKAETDLLRPMAAEELKAQLDGNPDTRDFTGTVVFLCEGKAYKIRVQRPDNTDWLSKKLKDPQHKEYKALMAELAEKQNRKKELEEALAANHPKCVQKGFTIGFMSK